MGARGSWGKNIAPVSLARYITIQTKIYYCYFKKKTTEPRKGPTPSTSSSYTEAREGTQPIDISVGIDRILREPTLFKSK